MKSRFSLVFLLSIIFICSSIGQEYEPKPPYDCSQTVKIVDEFTGEITFRTHTVDFQKVDYNPIGDFIERDAYIMKHVSKSGIKYRLRLQITNTKERSGMKGVWIILDDNSKFIRDQITIKSKKVEAISIGNKYQSRDIHHFVDIPLSIADLAIFTQKRVVKYRLGEFENELNNEISEQIKFFSNCIQSLK